MSTVSKTFTQEEKEAIHRAIIKIEKVKNRLDDYIHIIELEYWWRPNKKSFSVMYQDFREDTLGMYEIHWWGGYYAVPWFQYKHIKNLNTLLQLSDTVMMDIEMVEAYSYLLEQLKQEGVDNDYY